MEQTDLLPYPLSRYVVCYAAPSFVLSDDSTAPSLQFGSKGACTTTMWVLYMEDRLRLHRCPRAGPPKHTVPSRCTACLNPERAIIDILMLLVSHFQSTELL